MLGKICESIDCQLQGLQNNTNTFTNEITWVDYRGNPVEVGREVTACDHRRMQQIQNGELIGDISELLFRDPNSFKAGELHNHFEYWQYIATHSPSPQQTEILGWMRDKVSVQPYFKHFKGCFKGEVSHYGQDLFSFEEGFFFEN